MSLKCKDQSLDVIIKLKSSGMSCDHSVLGSSLIRALLVTHLPLFSCIKNIFQGSGWFPPFTIQKL